MTNVTLTPNLAVSDAAAAIDFYRRAFNAVELMRFTDPGGKVAHAEIGIGGARISLKDEDPDFDPSPASLGGTTVRLDLVVDDVDAMTERAIEAGARVIFPVQDQEYGFRAGRLQDPFGHFWIIQTPLASNG